MNSLQCACPAGLYGSRHALATYSDIVRFIEPRAVCQAIQVTETVWYREKSVRLGKQSDQAQLGYCALKEEGNSY